MAGPGAAACRGGAGRLGARTAFVARLERTRLSDCSRAFSLRSDRISSRRVVCARCWMIRVVAAPAMARAVMASLSLVAAINLKNAMAVPAPAAAPDKAAHET